MKQVQKIIDQQGNKLKNKRPLLLPSPVVDGS
jgi:hypothetical protein